MDSLGGHLDCVETHLLSEIAARSGHFFEAAGVIADLRGAMAHLHSCVQGIRGQVLTVTGEVAWSQVRVGSWQPAAEALRVLGLQCMIRARGHARLCCWRMCKRPASQGKLAAASETVTAEKLQPHAVYPSELTNCEKSQASQAAASLRQNCCAPHLPLLYSIADPATGCQSQA